MARRTYSGKDVRKVLVNCGPFYVDRIRGDHYILRWDPPEGHDTDARTVPCPRPRWDPTWDAQRNREAGWNERFRQIPQLARSKFVGSNTAPQHHAFDQPQSIRCRWDYLSNQSTQSIASVINRSNSKLPTVRVCRNPLIWTIQNLEYVGYNELRLRRKSHVAAVTTPLYREVTHTTFPELTAPRFEV